MKTASDTLGLHTAVKGTTPITLERKIKTNMDSFTSAAKHNAVSKKLISFLRRVCVGNVFDRYVHLVICGHLSSLSGPSHVCLSVKRDQTIIPDEVTRFITLD